MKCIERKTRRTRAAYLSGPHATQLGSGVEGQSLREDDCPFPRGVEAGRPGGGEFGFRGGAAVSGESVGVTNALLRDCV